MPQGHAATSQTVAHGATVKFTMACRLCSAAAWLSSPNRPGQLDQANAWPHSMYNRQSGQPAATHHLCFASYYTPAQHNATAESELRQPLNAEPQNMYFTIWRQRHLSRLQAITFSARNNSRFVLPADAATFLYMRSRLNSQARFTLTSDRQQVLHTRALQLHHVQLVMYATTHLKANTKQRRPAVNQSDHMPCSRYKDVVDLK
jgi:hypothetical protein